MLRLDDGTLVLAATDLTNYLACAHLTQQRLAIVRGERAKPRPADDPHAELIRERGERHEAEQLARLSAGVRRARRPVDARTPRSRARSSRRAAAATSAGDARRRAADLPGAVLRRALAGPGGLPAPDRRAIAARRLRLRGARHQARAAGQAHGRAPAQPLQPAARPRSRDSSPRYAHVVLGDGRGRDRRPRALRRAPSPRRRGGWRRWSPRPRVATYPEPVAHCAICALADECRQRWIADDHLSLVAGARRDQRERLVDRRPPTDGARWRSAPSDVDPRPLPPERYDAAPPPGRSFRSQSRDSGQPTHRHLEPKRAAGYALLPAAQPGRRVLRSRGRPLRRRRRASSTCGAGGARSRATSASGRTTPTPRRPRSSGSSTASSSCAPSTLACTSSTTPRTSCRSFARSSVKYATREDEVDDLLRAERARRPLRGGAPGAAGRRGQLLAQEARAPPRLRAPREARARGRRLDRRLRDLA